MRTACGVPQMLVRVALITGTTIIPLEYGSLPFADSMFRSSSPARPHCALAFATARPRPVLRKHKQSIGGGIAMNVRRSTAGGTVMDVRRRRPDAAPRHMLFPAYSALLSLIAVKAVVVQSLPKLLAEATLEPERVAGLLSNLAAGSAALEFLLLPTVAAISDTHGRKPLLVALPALIALLRLMVLVRPGLATLVVSRVVVGALVNYFDLFVGVVAADVFAEDSERVAGAEGKIAAAWGAAHAVGMLIGGRILIDTGRFGGPLGTYACSFGFSMLALFCALGARETLPAESRVRFSLRGSHPLSFTKLFRSGPLVATLASILALQALHDGEGDIWPVYGTDVRGWGAHENAVYGAAVGVAATAGGMLTGSSVRLLGNQLHTLLWTLSTALSTLLFATASTTLALASVLFCAAEDCMSAAVVARLVQAGGAAGLSQGQLAGAVHNLSAVVRVLGLFAFGRLYLAGRAVGLPQLPYIICAATLLAAAILVVSLPAALWRSRRADAIHEAEIDAPGATAMWRG